MYDCAIRSRSLRRALLIFLSWPPGHLLYSPPPTEAPPVPYVSKFTHHIFFRHFLEFANIDISRFHANFCKFGFTMSGAAKKIKSLFKSSIPVRRDDMWDRMEFGFPEKNSPRLHRAPILWMNKIYSHNGLSVLRPLDRIFDIWHEVTGVQLEVWSVPPEVVGGPLFTSRLYWMMGNKILRLEERWPC